jgi:hypothetical protein
MPIASVDDFFAAQKQVINIFRTAANKPNAILSSSINPQTGAGLSWGHPGLGVVAHGSSLRVTGEVPTHLTQGFPRLDAFPVGAKGYILHVESASAAAGHAALFDLLFRCGTFAQNTLYNLNPVQPSFAARLPGGDYLDTGIWVEQAAPWLTSHSGSPATCDITVGYLNESGVAKSTGAQPWPYTTAMTAGGLWNIPLAAGDRGVSQITSVNSSTNCTNGLEFNVYVLRRILLLRQGQFLSRADLFMTGLPEVHQQSALLFAPGPDAGNYGAGYGSEIILTIGSY